MEENTRHKIVLTNRESLDVDGVINVEKFTDEDIMLETDQGMLNIKGEKMYMKQLNLDAGVIAIEGLVKSMTYHEGSTSGQKEKSLLSRLLK
ncbi:Sporulation protein YabP [Tepidanaerobacter acetatoxydans Re1]|uniref:Sporulation protein YabP n=1 Tax=Tepidanaerobacter acetatoxydans (strain DSM 21804 / JCM 16047 / Re1) TaxID=1209989 RepID=F4LSS2_TEPAE|nr:sporulation protein YabP [Tepidanaerobacter acetatoxydans]AEE90385.1 sporulation protein YabP [Tepidanaerobacter acetatoxydans Re1]CCP24880.1 Sporulation protein YabP [Tepidanaerobacter acetatoxydans Re1]